MRVLLASVLLVSVSACSSGQKAESAAPPKAPAASPSASAAPGQSDGQPDGQPDASETDACSAVRAGINAFNAGDFSITVDQFRKALPLAKAQAEADPSKAADELVEAVTYYAELSPQDYPTSAASSPDFLKYKTITLGQCVVGGAPLDEPSQSPGESPGESPGVTT